MTEEELVIFDILTRPAPELSTEERNEIKKVARELLTRLKELLVLNWRQKSSARSQVKLAIEDVLDTGLPRARGLPNEVLGDLRARLRKLSRAKHRRLQLRTAPQS